MNMKDIFRSTDDPYIQQSYVKLGLPQREREIFESADFDYTGGVLLRREERESDVPEYLRLHNIISRTRMTDKRAKLYRKYLTQIAPNLYRTFESWMKQRGIEPGLKGYTVSELKCNINCIPENLVSIRLRLLNRRFSHVLLLIHLNSELVLLSLSSLSL